MIPALEIATLGLRVGTTAELLANVSLLLPPGGVVALAGPAGAGKTLLVEVAALARRPSRGSLRLFGQEVTAADAAGLARLRRRIGWVEAEPAWIAGLDAAGNAALPLRIGGMPRRQAIAQAGELLGWLGAPARPDDTRAATTRRRMAIARAVLAWPELVLVDELAAMEPALLDRCVALVERLSRQGVAFLVTSRDEAVLRRLPGATVLRIDGGRIAPRADQPA